MSAIPDVQGTELAQSWVRKPFAGGKEFELSLKREIGTNQAKKYRNILRGRRTGMRTKAWSENNKAYLRVIASRPEFQLWYKLCLEE